MDFSLRFQSFLSHLSHLTYTIITFILLCVAFSCCGFSRARAEGGGVGGGGHLLNITEWQIKIMPSQGILLKPVQDPPISTKIIILDLQFVANHLSYSRYHFMSELELEDTAFLSEESQLKLDQRSFQHATVSCILDEEATIDYQLVPLLLSHLTKFQQEALLPINLKLSLPLDDLFVFKLGFHGLITQCKRDTESLSVKLRLKLPIRPSASDMKIYQVQFVQFLVHGSVCGPREAVQNSQQVAAERVLVLVKDGGGGQVSQVYRIPPGVCSLATCHIPPEVNQQYFSGAAAGAAADPCLSAIYQDQPVAVLESLCQTQCRPFTTNDQVGPYGILFGPNRIEVIEINATLYISKATSNITLNCTSWGWAAPIVLNFTPPALGALELKIFCGCELYYKELLIWSRKNSAPPTCVRLPLPPQQPLPTSGDSVGSSNSSHESEELELELELDMYELLPSQLTPFSEDTKSTVRRSEFERSIFYNLSNTLFAKHVVEEFLRKNSTGGVEGAQEVVGEEGEAVEEAENERKHWLLKLWDFFGEVGSYCGLPYVVYELNKWVGEGMRRAPPHPRRAG